MKRRIKKNQHFNLLIHDFKNEQKKTSLFEFILKRKKKAGYFI